MKVKALRGVCIGVDRHLIAGDIADLEPGLVTFLVNIGAVCVVKDEPPKPDEPAPGPAQQQTPAPSESPTAKKAEATNDSTPAKPAVRRSSNAQ